MAIINHPFARQDLIDALARGIEEILQAALIEVDGHASGDLFDSIFVYPSNEGLVIEMLDYGEVLNEGLSGQKENQDRSRFVAVPPTGSFAARTGGIIRNDRYVFVSAGDIHDWIQSRGIQPRGGIDQEQLGYAIATSIINKGYEPRGWFDLALRVIDEVFEDLIGAVVEDTIDEILRVELLQTFSNNVKQDAVVTISDSGLSLSGANDPNRKAEVMHAVRMAIGILRQR